MSGSGAAILGFVAMLLLIAVRMPVGLSMLVVGSTGYAYLSGWGPFLAYMKTNPYYQFANYTLSVIPLFILMGAFAERSGLSTALFKAASSFIGHLRGGLAMAVIAACTAFGDLRLLRGDDRDLRPRGAAGAAPPSLRARPRDRHHRGRRHARHPHPALGDPRRVRDHHRAEHREALHGGLRARGPRRDLLLHRDRLVVRRNPELAPPHEKATGRERVNR